MGQHIQDFLEPRSDNHRNGDAAPTDHVPGAKPGVLVVDDEHLVRIMVQLGLERSGFEVWVAANGREAIKLYREHRQHITVVLLDIRMPGLDGPQTLDALREIDAAVMACFMSGDMGGYEPEKLLRCGAAQIIAKPFHLEQLVDVLRRIASGAADTVPCAAASRG